MSSDLLDGKRKRSDTESIGNNFPEQNILSNMDFSHPNCAMVMEELAKARLKMDPYDTTGGWRDPMLWSTLMGAVVGSNCPKMRNRVWEIIFTFELLFLRDCCFEISDVALRTNVYTVFGPGPKGDAGSLRTCNLDPKFLAVRRVDSDAVPLLALECDAGECVVQDGGECVVQHGGGPSNSPPNQSRKKLKMAFSAPSKFERLSNPNNPSVPPRLFQQPMYTVIDRNEMVQLYHISTEHLSPHDAGIFLYYAPPGSATFQSLALLPFAERKATIDSAVKEYKVGHHELHPPPPYYLSHHRQDLMAETKLSLTLVIDSKAKKVLFAEAGKDFVDFLFNILSLPVGTAVKLLNKSGTVCSIGSVYKSVESLSSEYFQANVNKDVVLKPNAIAVVNVPLLKLNDVAATSREIYACCSCGECWSHDPSSICPHCEEEINSQLTYVPPPNAAGGYVKEGIFFMVMDNLEVKPLSTMSGISVMDKFNVKDYSAIVEKKVQVGFTEGLAMLKASFDVTNSVLTTVFLSNNEVV